MGASDDREGSTRRSLPREVPHDLPRGVVSESITEKRKWEEVSDHDYTTVDVGTDAARGAGGYPTAISPPFSGTPTSLAAGGPVSSSESTAQTARAIESAPPPTAEPASNPDPTTSTRLDPGFVHLVPGTLVGEYEVEKLLGSGGMGAVYGARHERLRKKAAIKVIAPNLSADRSAVERFEQEALALAQLSHPNIVAVSSIGTLPGDGRAYYVMEYLDGQSLHDHLERGCVPFADALDILDQIARGLDAAHAAGIVHRDLKPANCWLQQVRDESRRIVKILDLGLAKLAEHRRSEETAVNVMFGTPNYMSPEQCQSARDVGPETDVYALGCIAYELLCGRLPFTYDNAAELVVAHGSETPPAPRSLNPTIPPDVDALLTGMLAKDPSHRPTLAQVRRTITTALAAPRNAPRPSLLTSAAQPRSPTPVAQTRPASTVPIDEPRASRRVFVTLAGLVVLGVVVAAVVAASGGASLDKPGRVSEEPRSAIEIDARVPPTATAVPSVPLDASVPLETPALRIDASTVTPRPNVDHVSSSIALLLDGGTQESEPTVVVEPDGKPAADPSATDAGVESADDSAPIEGDASVRPATTSPPARRTPPVPAVKRPPVRNVIVDPFRKKQVTK